MGDMAAALEAARGVQAELAAAHAKIKTLEARLLAMQRAASESQRLAAEAQEALDTARRDLAAATGGAGEVETKALARAAAAEKELAAEKERAAAAEKAHAEALAAARAEAASATAPLRAAAAASAAEAARERERCAELQRSVEHLTRAGEEAKELWARLKEALLVRLPPAAIRCPTLAALREFRDTPLQAEDVREAPAGTLKAMMAASADPDAFAAQCAQLEGLAGSDPAAFAELLSRGVASVVCVGMAVHRQNSDVQKWGCAVLGRLAPYASDGAGEALRAATAGAVEAVVGALRAHVFSLEVQEQGCSALTKLTFRSADNRARASAVGAVEVLGACMRVHGAQSPIVHEQAWYLLGALAAHAAQMEKAGGSSAGAAVAQAADAMAQATLKA